jgi:parallel beta-helix repeat protein
MLPRHFPLTLLSLLLLVAFSSAAFAQNVSAVILAPQTVDAHEGFTWTIDVLGDGTTTAHNVVITGSAEPGLGNCGTVVDTIFADSHATLTCGAKALGAPGDIVLHAHAGNSDATRTIHAINSPDVTFVLTTPVIDPGLPFKMNVFLSNASNTYAASNATLTIVIPAGIRVTTLPENCTQSGSTVTCSTGPIPAGKTNNFLLPDLVIGATADDSTNGKILAINAEINIPEPEGNLTNNRQRWDARVFRTFFVTDTAPDSLAAAIDQANLSCTDDYPCKVAFRLGTPPESGYFTLKPERALPKITGKNISIDGTTQTRLVGDTNANGPEILIDGSHNAWEDAIVFDEPCEAELAGLAIGNFKNAAVTLNGAFQGPIGTMPCNTSVYSRSVHDNFLGVAPSGTQAAPNGRGVVINERLYQATAISNNVISGNRHSGIWMGIAYRNAISGNTIGIDIHHQPLPNGASGIFVGPMADDVDIRGNYVAFNHDFGVAVDRHAIGTDIGPNSIFANLQPGIDVGLDGPTPDRDVPAPVVLSAQYDPATNTTVLTISTSEHSNMFNPTLIIYASDAPHPSGYGDGQYYLGSIRFDPTKGNVQFAALGDWRGRWASATVTRNNFFGFLRTNAGEPNAEFPDTHSTTSEFSKAILVQ